MTIKEIELLSGMTRANIRFYEAEGMLTPARRENGYRAYGEKDLETLKKIKLLRALRFSLEEIKRLQAGEQSMDLALGAHLETLQAEELQLQLARQICETIRSDGVTFGTMDAQRYLDAFSQKAKLDSPVPYTDALPRVQMPWRRYFARMLDLFFYSVAWGIFLALVCKVNLANRTRGMRLFDNLVALGLMLLLEPRLLSWFGTTPGKWILGLYVTDNEGYRLSISEAFSRTWRVFRSGMGLGLPIVEPITLGWSLWACNKGKSLSWEYDSEISLKDSRSWRGFAYVGAYAVLFGVLVAAILLSMLPKNRGEINLAQFSENYNQQARYHGYDTHYYLDEAGHWAETYEPGVYYVDFFEIQRPEFVYSETDGILTGLSFSVTEQGDRNASLYSDEMLLCVYSFLGAQKGIGIFSGEVRQVTKKIVAEDGKGFAYQVGDFEIVCEVSYSGYYLLNGYGLLIPQEGVQSQYSFYFSIQKQGS